MKIQVILPAAGSGIRLKSSRIKSLIPLVGKPLIVHTLGVFERSHSVESVIVVAHPHYIERIQQIVNKHKFQKVKCVVAGGATRSQSVRYGLRALDEDTDFVLIHDAARPLVGQEIIDQAIAQCPRYKAVIAAVPVKSTIKVASLQKRIVQRTLNRKTLWEVQTPQIFAKDLIVKAHNRFAKIQATDDAMLVEKLGVKVKIIEGSYTNIKITTPDDVLIAEAFLAGERKTPCPR